MKTNRAFISNARAIAACLLLSAALFAAASDAPPSMDLKECLKSSYAAEKAQDYEEAIRAIVHLKDVPAATYVVNFRLGWLYYLNANYANSRHHYQEAMKANPMAIDAKLGYLLPVLAQGNYDEVEVLAQQILDVDPNNYYANLRLAYAYRMERKFALAEKIDTQMLQYYPIDVTFLSELALTRVGQGKRDEAKKIWENILTLDSENATAKLYIAKP